VQRMSESSSFLLDEIKKRLDHNNIDNIVPGPVLQSFLLLLLDENIISIM
jgi:hypothetical protein